VSLPKLSQRSFNLPWFLFAIAIGVSLATGWRAPVALSSLILGLTDLYDVATRWRDPIATPRYSNVTIPGTGYRFPPRMEIGLEATSGLAFSAIGAILIFSLF
jgi:hypothetical protein